MKPTKIRTIITHPKFNHYIPDQLNPGTSYYFKCPECGKIIVFTPRLIGNGKDVFYQVFCNNEECKERKTSIAYMLSPLQTPKNEPAKKKQDSSKKENNVANKKDKDYVHTIHPDRPKEFRKGVLNWGCWPFSHSYALPIGTTLIGRKSKDSPANIQIRDSYMSENSVTIDVQFTERGYTFDLIVKRATNPVYLGARQCPIGSRVPLDDGDIIKMGNTTLRFKLENNKTTKR